MAYRWLLTDCREFTKFIEDFRRLTQVIEDFKKAYRGLWFMESSR